MTSFLKIGAAWAVSVGACASFAQTPDSTDTTVVTATRVAQPIGEVLADVSLIDREAIQRSAFGTVGDLLGSLVGVDATSHGSNAVFIRGAEARMTAVFIDGVRVDRQDGYTNGGGAPWSLLPLQAIDRIEILRGPASGVYGSDAMGGVVQLFTRDGRDGAHSSVSVEAGSQGSASASAALAGNSGAWDFALSGGFRLSDGYNTKPDVLHIPSTEAWDDQHLALGLGYRISAAHHIGLRATQQHRDSLYVPWNGGQDIAVQSQLDTQALTWSADWSPRLSTRLRWSGAQTQILETAPRDHQTRATAWLLDGEYRSALGTLHAALEHKRDRMQAEADAWSPPQSGRREQTGASLGWGHRVGPHAWQINLRQDSDTLLEDKLTHGLSYGYDIGPRWRAHLGTSTGFRSPTLSQLYDPAYGAADLQPESSASTEAGLRYLNGASTVKAVWHRARFKNLISSRAWNDPVCAFCWYNVGRAETEGLSLSGHTAWGATRLAASMDWLRAINSDTGKRLNLRAPRQLNLSVEQPLGVWSARADWQLKAQRWDDAANTKRLPGVGLLGLGLSRALSDGVSLRLRVDNALDRSYQEVHDFAAPGRRWYLGLAWQGQ